MAASSESHPLNNPLIPVCGSLWFCSNISNRLFGLHVINCYVSASPQMFKYLLRRVPNSFISHRSIGQSLHYGCYLKVRELKPEEFLMVDRIVEELSAKIDFRKPKVFISDVPLLSPSLMVCHSLETAWQSPVDFWLY